MHTPFLPRTLGSIVLGVSLLAGCSTWRVQEVTPTFQGKEPERVRVTRTDGSELVVDRPRLTADSLVGESRQTPITIPLSDVQTLAVRRGDTGKTLVLIGGLTGALFVIGSVAMEDCCGAAISLGGD
jgi:hypothetical protein